MHMWTKFQIDQQSYIENSACAAVPASIMGTRWQQALWIKNHDTSGSEALEDS
jgi:hypothetical protein